MLVFPDKNLTFLATPKTGTTALETALRPHAQIIFAKGRKHITARRYVQKVAPFLADTFGVTPDTCAVMRDPIAQIKSWYRYRARDEMAGTARSTRDISFDDFVRAVIADDPPEFAKIGSQHTFLTSKAGEVLVDHLFAYENQPELLAFLTRRFGVPIAPGRQNVSPPKDAPLSEDVAADLRTARAAEFALYERLTAAGGHLTRAGSGH